MKADALELRERVAKLGGPKPRPPGCVSVEPGKIDSPETIAARVRQAAQFLAPERITLNPDCGFAPGSGAKVDIDEAYQKICNEVAAAKMLREEFS